jgi:hypothetical protein
VDISIAPEEDETQLVMGDEEVPEYWKDDNEI